MAEAKTPAPNMSKTSGQGIARRESGQDAMQRRQLSGWLSNPFDVMDRMADEMDRTFDRIFRDVGMPTRSWFARSPFRSVERQGLWSPRIEAFQKGDRFIVRADLPGLKKDDVQVDVADNAVTIRGERQEGREEEREGYYHSEREYGQFSRTIPLPEGVITDSAQAAFKNGVLEISMQAPPAEASRGRRLEIQEGSEAGGQK